MFAGVILRQSRADPRDYATAEALLAALNPYNQADTIGHWRDNRAVLTQATTWNTPESHHEAAPEICPETGRIIVSWLRLDNRADLCAALTLTPRETLTDPQIVLAAHRIWGAGCADRLEGDFSFVIYDPAQNTAFCARDSLGAKPFFYWLNAQAFVFASTAAVFPALPRLKVSPSEEWITRYLVGASADTVKTAYTDISKLPPAHSLTVTQDTEPTPIRYFQFEDTAPKEYTRDEKWVDAYREAFHRAVEDRLRSTYLIGAESSGGLDSSTIVAHAAGKVWHGKRDFHCFGRLVFRDEPHYMLETALHCDIRHSHVITTPFDLEHGEPLTRVIRYAGYPPEHDEVALHLPFYDIANQTGGRTLLSGFGGDEIGTNQAWEIWQEFYLERKFKLLWQELPGGSRTRLAYLRRLRRQSRDGFRNQERGNRTTTLIWERCLLHPDAIAAHGIQDMLFDRVQRMPFSSLNRDIIDRRLGAQMSTRLESGTLATAAYGMEYRWPMLDRRLIAQYLATPSIEKRKALMGRYLHRRAVSGTIPDTILWKPDKRLGGMQPLTNEQFPMGSDEYATLHPGVADLLDKGRIATGYSTMNAVIQGTKDTNTIRYLPFQLQRIRKVSRWLNTTGQST